MSVAHALVTVTTEAVDLLAGVNRAGSRPSGNVTRAVVVTNVGTSAVLIGGPGMTASAYGYSLGAGEQLSLDLGPGDRPWARTASGSVQVRLLHLGV